MTNYLPYIFGLSSFLGGLYIFLVSFRLYKPKHKTEEKKERYEEWLKKFGFFMKICSVILILNGLYDLVIHNPDRYKIGYGNGTSEWTSGDRITLIKACMRDAGPTAINYPKITKEYCECSVDKIMKVMTEKQYEQSLSKPQEEQFKEIFPIIQECVTNLKRGIDSVDRQRH